MMNPLRGLFRSRDKPQDRAPVWPPGSPAWWPFVFGASDTGAVVNEYTAMQTTAVYACVRILSEAIASLPLHVYRYTDSGGSVKAPDHPLYALLHDAPNPEMTSFVFRETLMTHLLLWGNAFAQIIRNGRGEPIGLYPLLPSAMEVQRAPGTGEIVYLYSSDTGQVALRAQEVLHIPALGFDGLIGYSPIAMAKNAIGLAISTERYGSKFFSNGALPGGVLEHPGVIKDKQSLKESWASQFGGASNAGRVAVLEDGLKFHALSIPNDQAQFLQSRKYQLEEIARIFRVPPHMLGDLDKATFSNIEQQSLEFVKYSLDPWVVRWEQSLSMSLISQAQRARLFPRFNVDGLLRGDYQSRMTGYSIGLQNGFLSPNDVRDLENLNPIPSEQGGDQYLVNGNMMRLQDAGAAYRENATETIITNTAPRHA
jgi:HK97 family phage portal protein